MQETTIRQIVERIVSVASPLKIILFGSAARETTGSDSDLDFLVVVATGQHRRKTAQKIYRNLIDLGFATDIVVVTADDLERYRDNPAMVIGTALEEGKELYAA